MERPQVNIVQNQSVESTRDITGYEAEEILRKYGYQNQGPISQDTVISNQNTEKELTFEEMIARQNQIEENEKRRVYNKINGPKPITFHSNQYDSEVKYGSDDESGFGFKIEISTDMKLPKY